MMMITISNRKPLRGRQGKPSAFTLIETAIVTAIVGVGILALVQLLAAGSVSNYEGTELTTAVNLGNNIHEIISGLATRDPELPNQWSTKETTVAQYDDVLDFDGATFSPPIDITRASITSMTDWQQSVNVETVSHNSVSSTRPSDVTEPTVRVTVTVSHHGQSVYQASWLVANTQ